MEQLCNGCSVLHCYHPYPPCMNSMSCPRRGLKRLILAASLAIASPAFSAIVFNNGDLAGTTGYGNAPTGWSGIPNGTAWSEAETADGSAPILMGPTGPNVGVGYFGVPHSGSTFAGGIYREISGNTYQQGIQQAVGGFTVGETYTFSFFQAVVGYSGAQDDTGSWKVFANGELIATTIPSTTTVAWNAPDKAPIWEERFVTFTATAETINFGFLAFDPEGLGTIAEDGVMMGIDTFSEVTPVPEPAAVLLGAVGLLGLMRRRRI